MKPETWQNWSMNFCRAALCHLSQRQCSRCTAMSPTHGCHALKTLSTLLRFLCDRQRQRWCHCDKKFRTVCRWTVEQQVLPNIYHIDAADIPATCYWLVSSLGCQDVKYNNVLHPRWSVPSGERGEIKVFALFRFNLWQASLG